MRNSKVKILINFKNRNLEMNADGLLRFFISIKGLGIRIFENGFWLI